MNGNGRAVVRAGVVLGLGLGGFVDGIVLHQVLQWHHLLTSAGYPPDSVGNLQVNTLADGLFHAGTWALTLLGVVLLWRALRQPGQRIAGRAFAGSLILGWGIFNLVEGLIDHQILGIHHVRPGPNVLAYDLGFLAIGLLLALVGAWMIRAGGRATRGLSA